MSEERASVKTTMNMRNIANPRRTTLAQLRDADELSTEATGRQAAEGAQAEDPRPGAPLPAQTANPRRTVLEDTPAG